MKKNIKLIGVAAATLLAIAPVITSSDSVLAADKITNSADIGAIVVPAGTTNKVQPYFTYDGQTIANPESEFDEPNIIPLSKGLEIKKGETLKDLYARAAAEVSVQPKENYVTVVANYNNIEMNLYGQGVRFDDTTSLEKLPDAKITSAPSGFYVTVEAVNTVNGKTGYVRVPFGTAYTVGKDAPHINVESKSINGDVNGLYFQVKSSTKFDPINFTNSNGENVKIGAGDDKITVDENTVDTSKPGSYGTVKLTATNSAGKKTTVSYTVYVTPKNSVTLNLPDKYTYTTGYHIYGDRLEREVTSTIDLGTRIYVGNDTRVFNNKLYTRISLTSQAKADSDENLWIETSDLCNEDIPKTVTKTVMHTAKVYSSTLDADPDGAKINAYTKVKVLDKLYLDGKYYKIADKEDTYIKASNVDGTTRTLKHNAYVYATSTRRAKGRQVLKKGTKVTTYGGSYKFRNGKKYYRIEGATKTNKRYVKVANFK